MEETILAQMVAFNQACKETEGIYHSYAKDHGLSDTTFLILYSLWECKKPYPQTELCSAWSYPPQTINSALKAMEQQGLIEISLLPGSKKNKQISFTAKGKRLAKKIVLPFMQAEQDTFTELREEERQMLISVMQKYTSILKSKLS